MWVGDRERSLAPGPQGTAWGDAASRPSRQRLPCNHAPDRLQMAGPSTVQDGLVAWSSTHSVGPASEWKPEVRGAGQRSPGQVRSPGRSGLGTWASVFPCLHSEAAITHLLGSPWKCNKMTGCLTITMCVWEWTGSS